MESSISKMTFTGKEIEVGQSPFDLAEYARDANTTQKLYINEIKDMYVEVNVKSKQMDEERPRVSAVRDGPIGRTTEGTGRKDD